MLWSTAERVRERSRANLEGIAVQTVITIHGIRTRGKWQKDIAPFLSGFVHEPIDFGNFLALQLARSKSRQAQIEFFRDEYTRILRNGPLPSVIAHSFGTYIVARAIELFPEIQFDRIIFCGSIVSDDFDWDASNGQFSCLLNDCGKRDIWSWLAGFIVSDAGQSGVTGFRKLANGAVENRIHPQFRHSDYFYKLNYEKQWIPFLRGASLTPLSARDRRPVNWRFITVRVLLIVLFSFIAMWTYGFVRCVDWPWDGDPGPLVKPHISQESLPSKSEVFAAPRFVSDDVRLTMVNGTKRNIVVFMFGCEFAFPEGKSESDGWYQVFMPKDGRDYVKGFPGNHGWHAFFVKGKCDTAPVRVKILDIFQGRYPIVTLTRDSDDGYVAELTFGTEGIVP